MNNIAQIELKIDEQQVQNQIQQIIAKQARPQLLFWDIDDMTKLTPYGKTFLEENILCDPRMKALERRKGEKGKRIWPYEESSKVLKNIIMNEW